MSLAAIQDNLVKTSLVQHTQTRNDDVNRGQENAALAHQREINRQEDQVVIHTKETENRNVRTDEEHEKERRRRKREEEEEEEAALEEGEDEGEGGPRARMRRINIVI
ncbi:MAG: hypothetical protein LUE17_14360 [Planctomycetaceae bacterium]|nr:hypothetical protein [Planctomycetaceae bacterium]